MAKFFYHTDANVSPNDLQTAHGTLDVYGLAGSVQSTSIGLKGLTHEYPADLDMVLVGPDGQHNLAFMTDAGGVDNYYGIDIAFSDNGSPLLFQFANGNTYLPLDLGTDESGTNWGLNNLAVNHASHGETFGSAFGGINGNGLWSLYIHDDAAVQTGGVDGWNLTIETYEAAALLNGTSGADTITVHTTDFGSGEGTFQMNQRGSVGYSDAFSFLINGGGGNDTITADQEMDTISGGQGKDSISAGASADTISIGAFDDVAGETYDGGTDYDWLTKESYQTLDLRDDNVKNIESFWLKAGGKLQLNTSNLAGVAGVTGGWDTAHPDIFEVTMGQSTYTDLAPLNFGNFSQAGDKVVILGDGDAETIFASRVNDVIKAGGGRDIIVTNLGQDRVDGGKGSDTVSYLERNVAINVTLDGSHRVDVKVNGLVEDKIKNVENVSGGSADDILRGDSLANSFKGNSGADKLRGMGGNDKLEGGFGVDKLWGGSGNDKFVFASPVDTADHIKDFSHADDTIVLDNLYFTAFAQTGGIGSKMFHANASGHDAHTAKQHLIYDKADHSLWYDADGNGNGAGVKVAIFDNGVKNLDFHDFLIV